jgi:RNA polymerase sigma factor (sigma-70 family)
MSSNLSTQYSLIFRAIDLEDEGAWDELYRKYSRFIYYILNEMNVDLSDVDDVHQQVMLVVMRDLKNFDREKARFRTWLSVVIRSTTLMYFRKRDSLKAKQIRISQEFQDVDQLSDEMMDLYIEKEWKYYVMSLAMVRVRKTFTEKSIHIFELGLEGKSAQDISEETGETAANVYSMRKRIKKSLMRAINSVIKEIEC